MVEDITSHLDFNIVVDPKNVSKESSSSRIKDENNQLKDQTRVFPERFATLDPGASGVVDKKLPDLTSITKWYKL